MNKFTKLAGAAAAATLVAISGSAFTATSTIADSDINVGSVSQSISGATVERVTHSYTADSDTTTSLEVQVSEWLDTTAGVMKVKVNGGSAQDCAAAVITDALTDGANDSAGDYSTVTCDIADTANVTALQFIVNG